ncbi:MAG: deoxyribose-phosphate aldolase [Phycisphaeraceae bacterium]|jgi:deoxyribose-phosphate aldolase|nr:deoxyribose-phosphate aldolase [Phycisphaeraceae bacterium]
MNLAHRIDHTLLAAEMAGRDLHKVVAEALEYGFASVCVNGAFVSNVAKALHGSNVKTCAVAGFPLGATSTTVKAIDATTSVKSGAQEIDFVAHLPYLLRKDVVSAKREFIEIVKATRAANPQVIVKVIIESAVLMRDTDTAEAAARIAAACQAARESGCDFVKTSTGFHPAGGASVQAVELMKKHSGGLYVKASGGIRSYDDAKCMIDAGADRLGCSASVAIVQGGA